MTRCSPSTFRPRRGATLLLVAALAWSAPAAAQSAPPTAAPATANAAKLDPPLQDALRNGRAARVIVLGATQLFAPVGGLDTFIAAHPTDNRRTLRRDVIRTLKDNAAREQARILQALHRERADQSLWILNAMSMELSAADIARASTLPEVLFVYAGGEVLAPPRASHAPITLVPATPAPPFSDAGKRVAWNVAHLNAPRVWRDFGNAGQGAVVAVFDNGANYVHSDLRNHLWRNAGETPNNGVDDDRNGYTDDVYGFDFGAMSPNVRDTSSGRQHGTMTSGITVGDGTGGTITGVAPRAQLMLLKMTAGNVDGAGNRPVSAALGYQYALEQGADILSMSFSLPALGNLRGYWRMMSDHAVAAGLVLVGGAGNFRLTQPLPVQHQSPKDVPSVISVGGIDTTNTLVSFSSMGPAEWSTVALYGDYPMPAGIVKPDVVAYPGEGFPVLSITDSGYIDTNAVRIRGNSFAGPQVAGIAALMLTERPAMTVWRLRSLLEGTAHDLGAPGKDNQFGFGRVDAYEAVRAARATPRR
ncbi:MAG: S8 family serine peptidase [Gemmatimonadota bacterium]|nr:S8 family serine peptidase [Gemmatimonadota bacterium]MDQ8172002.1 S8 family serine peptidase [Gemmatimonadota bacterium]